MNDDRGVISISVAAGCTHTRDNNAGNGTSVGEQLFNYELVTVTLFERLSHLVRLKGKTLYSHYNLVEHRP